MEMTLKERLDVLLEAYTRHYDIERDVTVEGGTFPATATYYMRDENYAFSKKIVISALEQHEYLYFYLADHLDAETLQKQIDLSMKAGMARVKPHKEHMCSYVTLVILADTIDPEAQELIQKTRFHKSFRLSLQGWMELLQLWNVPRAVVFPIQPERQLAKPWS